MLLAPFLVSALSMAVPAGGGEGGFQPWMQVLAEKIRDEGYGCADVHRLVELGFEYEGRVALVICRAAYVRNPEEQRSYRVVFYTEGDLTVRPWRQEALR